jgi:serine/threonine protein kinase
MSLLGRYEIIEPLGTGAMGSVYRARDTALDREVALKTIRTGVDVDAEIRQRFYSEARACARLQHPGIITVYDLGEVENTAYIAMELLHGADFRRIIQDRQAIPVETKIAAVAQVCEAVAHAHRHGVVHRDIKPSNLFLTEDCRAKVLDFGIARLPSSRLTVAGQILGTPNYMAPEQILARPTDGRSDLFSIAIVFFELLTYSHPFQGTLIPRRIVQGDPDSLFDYDSTLPLILERVLTRGLAKDPDRRYQTGDEFATDLQTVLDAIRQNASPSFSKVELPSQRALSIETPAPQISGPIEVPPGVDPHEWRLSEALRLMPEFETAIDNGNASHARAALGQLETRLAGDIRFAEALRLCRSRLSEIDLPKTTASTGQLAAAPPAASPQTETQPAEIAVGAGAGAGQAVNLDDVTYLRSPAPVPASFQPPAEVEFVPREPAEPPREALPPQEEDAAVVPEAALAQQAAVAQEAASAKKAPDLPSAPPKGKALPPWTTLTNALRRLDPKTTKLTLIAAGATLCVILLAFVVITAMRPVPIEAAAATAETRRDAALYAGPAASEKKISVVRTGTLLNVLRLPESADQQWIRVQRVTPKVINPGYIRLGELADWKAKTGSSALALVRLFRPPDSATDDQIQEQIDKLNSVISGFPNDPAANEARLDISRWKLLLIRRQQEGGASGTNLGQALTSLRPEVEALAGDVKLQGQVLDLLNQIDALFAAVQAPPPALQSQPQPAATAQTPSVDINSWMGKARVAWEDGDYVVARQNVMKVLHYQSNNKEAQDLKSKIETALDREKAYATK